MPAPAPSSVARRAAAALLLAALAACSSPIETVRVPGVGPAWVPVFSKVRDVGEGAVAVWVPVGEEPSSWTRRMLVEFVEGSTESPASFVATQRRAVETSCGAAAAFTVLESDDFGVLYELRVFGCDAREDLHELGHVLRGRDGLHRIVMSQRPDALDPTTRAVWLRRLAESVVIKGDDMTPVFEEELLVR